MSEAEQIAAKPKCERCNDRGSWVKLTDHSLTGGPCDCSAGLRKLPLIRLTQGDQ